MKHLLETMTLREKIAQTGMPSPSAMRKGVAEAGSYAAYFTRYPFSGLYAEEMLRPDGSPITTGDGLKAVVEETSGLKIPLLITLDAEFGGGTLYDDLSLIPTNMTLGAADSPELAYKRGYYWAKELRAKGVNCVFGPVCDLLSNFLSSGGIRCLSDRTELIVKLVPHMIRGIRDAGMLATAKHYPGRSMDYRDPHFSMCENRCTREEWNAEYKPIWIAAAEAGVDAFMPGHPPIPALDASFARGKVRRPATASKKTLDILRHEIGFQGLIISDAVNMKALSSAFEHDDVYIECFNAGNDIVLFCHNDYIDVMEKAVLDGRVSMERLDTSAERILRYKKAAGLFDQKFFGPEMTAEDMEALRTCSYDICAKGATLLNNFSSKIPYDPTEIKSIGIIPLAPDEQFHKNLVHLQNAFAAYHIRSEIVPVLNSKDRLKKMSEEHDLIIYACYLGPDTPYGFPGYSQRREINTLFHGLSYGAEKSVVCSFGSHTVYYNYFEAADVFINMYTASKESMEAFADGLFGKFAFSGKSPVSLKPNI